MAQDRVQFQPGMSMPEIIARYGPEAQCQVALAWWFTAGPASRLRCAVRSFPADQERH